MMLVSARVDARLRRQVAEGVRPSPEFTLLEERHGVQLLDWSGLGPGSQRSGWRSMLHVAAALRRLAGVDVVFSDGEHVGIPLAIAMRTLKIDTPHLVLGHHLTTPAKEKVFRRLRPDLGMSRILVHSPLQGELAHRELGIPSEKLVVIPYYADASFWRPSTLAEEPLVVSAGREHRDYRTLAQACAELKGRVFVAAGSVHSPASADRRPERWPANFEHGFADYATLRDLYARARVVVVPVLETDFQAGITTVLEAMAMGKAVVATATRGQAGAVRDGINGLTVAPGDVRALRQAVTYLFENPGERARLGRAARQAVLDDFSVESYGRLLARHFEELAGASLAAA